MKIMTLFAINCIGRGKVLRLCIYESKQAMNRKPCISYGRAVHSLTVLDSAHITLVGVDFSSSVFPKEEHEEDGNEIGKPRFLWGKLSEVKVD